MFIHLPSTEYTATAEGSVIKEVTCENCGHAYSYSMSRIVTGVEKVLFSSSRGPGKALTKAQKNLATALETEHDDVSCPECGWHQAAHVAFVRSRLYPQLTNFAGAFFVFAVLAFVLILVFCVRYVVLLPEHRLPKASSMLQFGLIVLVVAAPGLLLRGLRSLLALTYQPNRNADYRDTVT
jgi:hypothetical protein